MRFLPIGGPFSSKRKVCTEPGRLDAEIVVRFLRDKGIDASVDESTGGFRYTAANATRASDAVFACVCLRASISYTIEAAYWCAKAKR